MIWNDTFSTTYYPDNNKLVVKRTDENTPWVQKLYLPIIFENLSIPKILIQTSKSSIPEKFLNRNKYFSKGWDYKFFSDEDIIKYFNNNPLKEFPNITDIFNSFKNGAHKADLFRYYFLWLYTSWMVD